MKKYIILTLAILLAATSCWKENIPEVGNGRHKISNLAAEAGNKTVFLSWTMAQNWSPKDYLISYYDNVEAKDVKLYTGGALQYTVKSLKNDVAYTFSVQAVYEDGLSGAESIMAIPVSPYEKVSSFDATAGNKKVTLVWGKPEALGVQGYHLEFIKASEEGSVLPATMDFANDVFSCEITGLENDNAYNFRISVKYEEAMSDSWDIQATPKAGGITTEIYTVSTTNPALGQSVNFAFNRADYPDATDILWTFPDASTSTDDAVSKAFSATGDIVVKLSAKIVGAGDVNREIQISVKEFLIDYTLQGDGMKTTCPVFSPDGKTAYAQTYSKGKVYLNAFSTETGALKWSYFCDCNQTGCWNPCVNPVNGDIYVQVGYTGGAEGRFYAIKSDGSERWRFDCGVFFKVSGPAVKADGSIVYFADCPAAADETASTIYAMNAETGAKIWSYASAVPTLYLVERQGELIAGFQYTYNNETQDNCVFFNASTGAKIAGCKTEKPSDLSGVGFLKDGKTMIVPCLNCWLSKVDCSSHTSVITTSGNRKGVPVGSNLTTPDVKGHLWGLCIGPDDQIYVTCKDGYVYCVKGNFDSSYKHGDHTWSHQFASAGNGINYGHPVCDASGNLYIVAAPSSAFTDAKVYKFPKTGGTPTVVWSFPSTQKFQGGLNFNNGFIFAGTYGPGQFYARYVGGERATSWCSYGGNLCGSNFVK